MKMNVQAVSSETEFQIISQTSYLYEILYSNHNKSAETEVKHTKICVMIKEYDTSIFRFK